MLETGFYRGIREDERLVSIAGVHVFSRGQGVAALGNVTTLPAFRGRGFGMQVCSTLCCELQASVATIGLNVKSDNQKAIRVYQKLGFRECVTYEEYYVCRKESQDSLRPERK
jgi:predicted GNAT family acetyltransferase